MNSSLGRGLESLIPRKKDLTKKVEGDNFNKENDVFKMSEDVINPDISDILSDLDRAGKDKKEIIFHIEVDKISPNPFQPRKEINEEELQELAESIRHYGVLQPIILSKMERTVAHGVEINYVLIAGERRWRAAKLVGLSVVPAIIKQSINPHERLEIALIENIQRNNLNSIEEAKAFQRLIEEFGLTQKEISNRLGRSGAMITNSIRLLSLSLDIQEDIREGRITPGHARALLSVRNIEKQQALRRKILEDNISVRKAEDLSRFLDGRQIVFTNRSSNDKKASHLIAFENELQSLFKTRVRMLPRGLNGARVSIDLFTEEDIEKFLDNMRKVYEA